VSSVFVAVLPVDRIRHAKSSLAAPSWDDSAMARARSLTEAQIAEALELVKDADSVELKLTVPDTDQRSAVMALGMDPLQAEIRQIVFFDTPDLQLDEAGLVVRARRVRKGGDATVKLRPVVPADLPRKLRRSPDFGVEVDAMPGAFVCSGSLKSRADNRRVQQVITGERAIRKLFSAKQRRLFAERAPAGVELDSLVPLGPVNVIKLKFSPAGFARRLVAELWSFPDMTRVLELSTKCAPDETVRVVDEARAYLTERGIDLTGEQATKTRKALAYFAEAAASIE
jgi:hypothetical protein